MYCKQCGSDNTNSARFCRSCGAALDVHDKTPKQSKSSDSPHDTIGPYELRGELGRGAMAVVWRGWDPNLQREVAIKEPLYDPTLSTSVMEEVGRRFVAEGRAVARLSHPNIVGVYAADVYDGRPAIIMELVDGVTLGDLLLRGPLTPPEALPIIDQLLDAVEYAHSRGVIHRDIKPENVFVTKGGVVKLADFGIARTEGNGTTRATVVGAVLGTPGYMSPEQARGAEVDGRSDLFTIAVLAYEMLVGKNPFGAGDGSDNTTLLYRIVHEPVADLPDTAMAGLPVDIRPAIMAALSKDPATRPQSAAEFRAMLRGEAFLAPDGTARRAVPMHSFMDSDAFAMSRTETGQSAARVVRTSKLPTWAPYALLAAVAVVIFAVALSSANSFPDGVIAPSTAVQETSADKVDTAQNEQAQSAPPESSSQNDSDTLLSPVERFPRMWQGEYEAVTVQTSSGKIWLNCRMVFSTVEENGRLEGAVYIQAPAGSAVDLHSSYELEGTIDWDSGEIRLYNTRWIDEGTMVGMRDFNGTMNDSMTQITGEAVVDTTVGPWQMTAD